MKTVLDWKILLDLAERLGRGRFFRYETSEAIFNELRLASRGGERVVPARAFFRGFYDTALATGEILVGAEIPPAQPGERVVLDGRQNLRNGTAVAERAPGAASAPAGPASAANQASAP